MFAIIRRILHERELKRDAEVVDRGYNRAAGALLQGTPIGKVEAEIAIYKVISNGRVDAYCAGVEQAVSDWKRRFS